MNRTKLLLLLSLSLAGCATAVAPPPAAPAAGQAVEPPAWGFTAEEEAVVLRLEDRREWDAAVAEGWMRSANPLQRRRMALALGRIGGATFLDGNGNGVRDAGEQQAGVALLTALVGDPSAEVRRAAAFALGEIGDASGLDALYRFASDQEHAGVAAEALEAISKMAARTALDRYVPYTNEANLEGIRAAAIRFLFRFDSDPASAVAAAFLGDRLASIRREAAYALSRRPYAPARQKLELLLTDPDTLTRSYAARALGRIGAAESLEPLFGAVNDIHPWVRTNAAVAIGQVAASAPEEYRAAATGERVLALITLSKDNDPGVSISAIDPLARLAALHEPARARLLEAAVDGSPWQREVAIAALLRHFGATSPEVVEPLLQTDSRFVKIRALEAARELGPAGARFVAPWLADGDPSVRAAAIGALAPETAGESREAIVEALDHEDPVLRSAAVEKFAAIDSIPPSERVERLREAERRARADTLNDARLAAVTALVALPWEERDGWLRDLLADRDPVVRRVAADALEALGHARPQYTPLPVDRSLHSYREIVEWARLPHSVTLRTGRGSVEIVLLSQDAPMTAWNFARLAAADYFDGTTFMRVVPNFVVQGGDPRNDQSGGPGYAIRDEINLQKYTRGALGMALSGPDTGGSQFFITHSPQPHLDGGYTIFGRVVGGMSGVVDQTQRGDVLHDVVISEEGIPQVEEKVSAVEKPPLPTKVGPITPEMLLQDLPEYAERKAAYAPDEAVLEAIAASIRPGDRLDVILGTWCSDSQREVPKVMKILDMLETGYGTALPVRWIAVDRSKRDAEGLVADKNIEKVATFIVYRGETELGRIEETPTGLIEDDLLAILSR